MARPDDLLAVQVIHPQHEMVERSLGGRSFDLVVDKEEFIGGMFTTERLLMFASRAAVCSHQMRALLPL